MKVLTTFVLVLLMLCLSTWALFPADHLESPLARANPAADINDIFAFVKGSNLILAMTVNPFLAPGAKPFSPDFRYCFRIDTDGDAKMDETLGFIFDQYGKVTLYGTLSKKVKKLFTGRREDPFFFDLDLLSGGPLGEDSFAGADVAAIVAKVPLSAVTKNGPQIGVWVTTKKGGKIIDRMGRPVINTLFIPEGSKDKFNKTAPKNDVKKWGDFVPDFLLPDILTIDTSQPAEFPNGRAPKDDVIDISLGLIGGGTDNVDANDVPFLNKFPFLAPPNNNGSAAAAGPGFSAPFTGDETASIPGEFTLEQAYPNPFNPSTQINYALPTEANVTLKIYNLVGQEIRTLVNGAQSAGQHAVTWNAKDNFGRDVPSGIYLYRIEVSGQQSFTMARRVTLLK